MSTGTAKRLANGIWAAWVTFFLIWLAATASLEPARVIAGLIVTGGIAWLAVTRTAFWAGLAVSPARLAAGLRYLAVFLREMVKSNLAVLGYVYSPRLDIAPRLVRVPTRLAGPRERLALTNTLTLTPGSLAVDLDGDDIEMHVLDNDLAAGVEDSVKAFEPLLEKALG